MPGHIVAPPPHQRLRRGTVLLGGALAQLLLVGGLLGPDGIPPAVGVLVALALRAGGAGALPALAGGLLAGAVAALAVLVLADHAFVLREPAFWTLGLGLAGAVDLRVALNRGPRGGRPAPLD
jgi:hypothetical protein